MANNAFIDYLNRLNIDLDFRLNSQDNPIKSLNGYVDNKDITEECLTIGGNSKLCKQPEENQLIKSNFSAALNNEDFISDYLSHFEGEKTSSKASITEGVEVVALLNFLRSIAYEETSHSEFIQSPSDYISNFSVEYNNTKAELSADVKDELLSLVSQFGDIKGNEEQFVRELFSLNIISQNLADNANIIW